MSDTCTDNPSPSECDSCFAPLTEGRAVIREDRTECADCLRRDIVDENQKVINTRVKLLNELKWIIGLFLLCVAVSACFAFKNTGYLIIGVYVGLMLPNILILFRIVLWIWNTMGMGRCIRTLLVDYTVTNIVYCDKPGTISPNGRLKDSKGRDLGLRRDKENYIRDVYDNMVGRITEDGYIKDNFYRTLGRITGTTEYHRQLSTMNMVGFLSRLIAFLYIAGLVLTLSPIILIYRILRRMGDLSKCSAILRSNDKSLREIRDCLDKDKPIDGTFGFVPHTRQLNKIERRAL